MMTKIMMADDADSWCRRLGNFAPIVYRPVPLPSASARAAAPGTARVFTIGARRGTAVQFLLVAMVAAGALPLSAAAQMPGGGMGGHGGPGGHGGRPPDAALKAPDAAAPQAPDPLRAMLGVARKLRTELLLTTDQFGAWSAMEDALRECVELERAPALPSRSSAPVDPQTFVQDMADHQRALADAEARFAARAKTAFAALNPRQLRTSKERFADAIAGEHPDAASATLP